MKYIKMIINACVTLMCLVLFSCSQDEEMYSCDKDINAWVKENMSDISRMNRKEWLEIGDINYQRAAYRTYTAEQKQTLWIGKICEVLDNVGWTPQERKHIEALLSIVKENLKVFDSNVDQKKMDRVEVDLYRWKEYAIEELKWSPELLYALVNTPEIMTADKQIARSKNPKVRLKNGSEPAQPDCDCNASIPTEGSSSGNYLCLYVFFQCSTIAQCTETSWGCGDFWLYNCNGVCVSR
jgi:hypothetical protein